MLKHGQEVRWRALQSRRYQDARVVSVDPKAGICRLKVPTASRPHRVIWAAIEDVTR